MERIYGKDPMRKEKVRSVSLRSNLTYVNNSLRNYEDLLIVHYFHHYYCTTCIDILTEWEKSRLTL